MKERYVGTGRRVTRAAAFLLAGVLAGCTGSSTATSPDKPSGDDLGAESILGQVTVDSLTYYNDTLTVYSSRGDVRIASKLKCVEGELLQEPLVEGPNRGDARLYLTHTERGCGDDKLNPRDDVVRLGTQIPYYSIGSIGENDAGQEQYLLYLFN